MKESEETLTAKELEKKLAEQKALVGKLQQELKELRSNELWHHKMIAEIQDYAIIFLDKDGIIQNWNKGAEKIKLYKEEEIVGKHFSLFYLPEDLEQKLPYRLMKEAADMGSATQEGWRKRKDGTKFWGSITITSLHGPNNDVIGYSKVTRDLTERKIAEDRLAAYTTELESQNNELEQFAYVASHDLQEPLRKIRIFTDMLKRSLPEPDETVKKYFDKIDNSSVRMSELIKSVLNYSRLSKDEAVLTEVDLNEVIENVQIDFELLIEEKNATILKAELPIINGYRLQQGQLFANLISNSLKFADKKPVISISSKIVTKDQVINRPAHLYDGNYYEIAIADNGIGFDQQYETLIFNMFQRLHSKQQYAGTGIGLALCKKIIENHHGYIAARGELGKGSVFYVYLPVAK